MVAAFPGLAMAALWGLTLTAQTAPEPADPKTEFDIAWGVKIPLRDDVKLNATVYRPKGLKEGLPVICTMTPYISDSYHDRGMYFAKNG
jgi:predicted acyl esterase